MKNSKTTEAKMVKALIKLENDEKIIQFLQYHHQCRRENIPYLTDFDVIMRLIQKQNSIVVMEYIRHYCKEKLGIHVLSATPYQLAYGLLLSVKKLKKYKKL